MDGGREDVDLGALDEEALSAWLYQAQQERDKRDRRRTAVLVGGLVAVLVAVVAAVPAFASDGTGGCGLAG